MAERRAINKYYPPDWSPSDGTINSYNGSHPLRSRARKIENGILTVRFEMPFNIWCLGCNNHIAMGVRFNAEKSKVGNYYTSPIYQFVMKCRLCSNRFVIETDPSKFDYLIKEGARRQILPGPQNSEDPMILSLDTEEEAKRRVTDSMFRLERKVEDRIKNEPGMLNLNEIKGWLDKREDSFALNQLVRGHYRQRRKLIESDKKRDDQILKRASLKISLVKTRTSDAALARQMMAAKEKDILHGSEIIEKAAILNSSQFIPRSSSKAATGDKASSFLSRKPTIKKER